MDANGLMSMNLALNVARKCRICGMDILDLTCAFPIFGNDRIDRKIERYLQLNIQIDDLLPKCVCGSCYLKLESIDQFALMANRTEEAFRAWIGRLRGLTCPAEAAKNVNVLLPLFRPDPAVVDSKKWNVTSQPKDAHTNPMACPSPASGLALDKGIISYSDLKLGLLIKDQELLKLILKALKWAENDRRATFEVLIQRLKNTSFREILSNRNLLNDSDLTQLLQSYIGQGVMNSFIPAPATGVTLNNNIAPAVILQPPPLLPISNKSVPGMGNMKLPIPAPSNPPSGILVPGGSIVNDTRMEEASVTQMEVGVDPDLYLPYEDEDSSSTTKFEPKLEERPENTVTIKLVTTNVAGDMIENKRMMPAILNVRGNKRFQCSACPECFATNGELQQHIVTRHLTKTNRTVITKQGKPAIKIRVRKSKPITSPLVVTPGTPVTIPSASVLSTLSPLATSLEQNATSSTCPITIVPLKIPASTTITMIPVQETKEKVEPADKPIPVVKPPVPDTEPVAVPPPKVELLVRKSKRKPTIKHDLCPISKKDKKGKVRKEIQQPVEQSVKAPRKATTTVCTVCRKKLATRETIREHMEREHSRYECEKCDRAFKSALNLSRHQQYHASVAGSMTPVSKAVPQKTTKTNQSEEPTHKCSYCAKAFKRSHHLKLHLIHHTKDTKHTAPRVAEEEKPNGGNGLRKRTKAITSAIRSAEGNEANRSKKSEMMTRKSTIKRKIRFAI